MMLLFRLYYEFFKTGIFAIGGGLATIPFLQRMADTTGWFTRNQLADMIAVSESTPGPVGINMATYVGFTTGGIPGAIIATIGLITPSIIIILAIAAFLKNFRDNKYIMSAFYGLRPASTGLIAASGLSVAVLALLHTDLFAKSKLMGDLFNLKAIGLGIVIFLMTTVFKKTKGLHPIVFIILSAIIGVSLHFAGV